MNTKIEVNSLTYLFENGTKKPRKKMAKRGPPTAPNTVGGIWMIAFPRMGAR